MSLLKATNDHYDGVLVSPEHLPADLATFTRDLTYSLKVHSQPCQAALQSHAEHPPCALANHDALAHLMQATFPAFWEGGRRI